MDEPLPIASRTVDGVLYLAADDVVRFLRGRSAEYGAAALDAAEYDHALCYEACSTELALRADALDVAAIEFVSA